MRTCTFGETWRARFCSMRARSTALVSSAGSYCETTSKEYSGMDGPGSEPVEDAVETGEERREGEGHHEHARAAQHHRDADLRRVHRLVAGAQLVGRERDL